MTATTLKVVIVPPSEASTSDIEEDVEAALANYFSENEEYARAGYEVVSVEVQ